MLERTEKPPLSSTLEARWLALRWLLLSAPLLSEGAAVPWGGLAGVVSLSERQQVRVRAWLEQLRVPGTPEHSAWLAAQPQFEPARVAQARFQEPHLRLGRLAERLLGFYLDAGIVHRGVAAHLPLRFERAESGSAQHATSRDHTTRGEIDFLVRCGAEHLHWELAVKFFLCVATGPKAQARDFIGPDGRETLERKLEKLFGKQLRHKAGPPFDGIDWAPQAFTRGWMFYRHNAAAPACDLLHPHHERGWWVPATQWPEFEASWNARGVVAWQVLDPHQWMPPNTGFVEAKRLDVAALQSVTMVAGMQAQGSSWAELVRCFITQTDTPRVRPLT